ncbi:MAG: peptide ABC transporter substrate-binding protein [Bdellovibrionaceae bacterium]|nr:peptide ABC transporter substrate-binding protein [Pseudobdellovibrionaceae bacterium]
MSIYLVLLVFIGLLSCPSGNAQDNEKILRIGIGQEFDSLNPLGTAMLSAMYTYNLVARNFVSLDHDMKWHPQLVEKIPSFENKLAEIKMVGGAKKLISIWPIRKNAKWGDGQDLTCEDVKFTWIVAQSNFVTVVNRDSYWDIEAVSCDPQKPKRVELVHKNIKWDFSRLYQFYILPKHLEEPVFKKFGSKKEGMDRNSHYVKDPINPGLYSGPYLMAEVKLGSHILLKRNPFFFGKKPYFDKILVQVIADTAALEASILSKQIDMISTIGLNMDQALALEKRIVKENLPFEVRYVSGFTYEHMELKMENPILSSKKIRKALVMAIDRKKMAEALFEGKQMVAPHFLSPRDPWFAKLPSQLKQPLGYSKKGAEKLLEEEGWVLSEDGYRYKGGKKLSVVYSTTAANRLRENVQTYIADQWKKVGIDTVVKNMPARTFFSEFLTHRKYEGTAMFSWTFLPQWTPLKFYSSKSIPKESNGWAGRNYPGLDNRRMDELLEQLELEMIESKRQKIINEVVEIYTSEHPTIPLYYRVDVSVVPKKLKGYYISGNQQLETLFVENWHY